MKKFTVILLALVMVFASSVSAFAADVNSPTGDSSITEPTGSHTLEELNELADKLLKTKNPKLIELVYTYTDLLKNGGTPDEIDSAYTEMQKAYDEYLKSQGGTEPIVTDPDGSGQTPTPTSPQTSDASAMTGIVALSVLLAAAGTIVIAKKKLAE